MSKSKKKWLIPNGILFSFPAGKTPPEKGWVKKYVNWKDKKLSTFVLVFRFFFFSFDLYSPIFSLRQLLLYDCSTIFMTMENGERRGEKNAWSFVIGGVLIYLINRNPEISYRIYIYVYNSTLCLTMMELTIEENRYKCKIKKNIITEKKFKI